MAQKKKPHLKCTPAAKQPSTRHAKKVKQPHMKPPQQRVMVIKKDGRRVMQWRDWGS